MIENMTKLGSNITNIKIKIGPHIKKCHFEVKSNTLDQFQKYQESISNIKNRIYIDLSKIIENQILDFGLQKSQISTSNICTYCDESFYSYRREGRELPESQVAYITMI